MSSRSSLSSSSFRSTRSMLGAVVVAGMAVLGGVGCTTPSANDAPIIDSVEAPLVVSARNGTYAIPVTILFHDLDGEVVTHVRYRLDPMIDTVVDIPMPNPTRESAELTLLIPASACAGKTDHHLEIAVVDGRGAESLLTPRAITLR